MSESRVRITMASALAIFAMGCLGVRLLYPLAGVPAHAPGWLVDGVLPRLRMLVGDWSQTTMMVYPVGLLAVLALERLIPAVPLQRTLSTGLVHDALWVLIAAVVNVLIVSWYSRFLYGVYGRHLSFLTLPVARSLPVPVRLVIGAVVLDLTRWCQHWLHHHVRWFWPFLHANHNYGAMLSVWDYLFCTQYRHYDVYPRTGIEDEKFPAESADSVWRVLAIPFRQMLYPFSQLVSGTGH